MRDEEQMRRDLAAALQAHPGVLLEMSGWDAWVLMGALQVVARHPGLGESVRARVEHMARTVQASFDAVPALAELAEQGWNPAADVRVGEEQER
jgi:hypothetical protein